MLSHPLGDTQMSRTLYALSLILLIGGTAWAASGMTGGSRHASGSVGLVLLVALQR